MATAQQQPKSHAQDTQSDIEQHSSTVENPDGAPLRFIEQLVDSAFSNIGTSFVAGTKLNSNPAVTFTC